MYFYIYVFPIERLLRCHCHYKNVLNHVLIGEAQHSKAFAIMLVFHLLLIHFGEGNNVTSITKPCKQKTSELKCGVSSQCRLKSHTCNNNKHTDVKKKKKPPHPE